MKRIKHLVIDYLLEPALPLRRLECCLEFLARLAVRLRKPFIISITGSVGKSTTTSMIAEALAHKNLQHYVGRVASTVGNMNDDVGIPATLLRYGYGFELPYGYLARFRLLLSMPFRALWVILTAYPRLIVLECGTDGRGRFARTINIAPPNIAVVTTIGAAHLENLRTLSGVAQEKGALVRAVSPSGLVILGTDHDYVELLEQMARAQVVKVSGRGVELSRQITMAICRHLGLPDDSVELALLDFRSPAGRLNRIEFPNMTVIDDTYNANPLSTKLGLDTLAQIAESGHRRVAILGTMAELGEQAALLHAEIGHYARERCDLLIGIGIMAKNFHPDLWFETSDDCAAEIEELIKTGDYILVKGSASTKMSQVVKRIGGINEASSARASPSPGSTNATAHT